ncbi:glycosyltransferase [Mitsuokella sp.]|uniref:glycosyltransferase n=1 Tax=Mitsuokella sp. TaxID=2049034 RepID=UPI003D7CE40F
MYDDIKENEVLILLSTYNGVKFLPHLLSSLMSQQEVKVFCLIRDDGSQDGTWELLETYASNNKNLLIYRGENVGPRNSFNDLINHPITMKYQWIAFCDQDDVWLPDKLITAIDTLKEYHDNSVPLLYCSNLYLVNSQLERIGLMHSQKFIFNKKTAMVQNIGTGCTEVFNQEAARLYRLGIGTFEELHDYWMFLVCIFMGRVVYDKNPHILYRQHENNVVGASKRSYTKAVKHILFTHSSRRVRTLNNFRLVYKEYLKKEDKDDLMLLSSYNSSVKKKLYLFFNPKYRASDFRVTVGYKLRILLGRLY